MSSQFSYADFAERFAARLANGVREAMQRQLSGEDEDIAEVNWQVRPATPGAPVEVYANVQCDVDHKTLCLTVDERDGSVPNAEFETTFAARLVFAQEPFIHVGAEQFPMTPGAVEKVLGDFTRATLSSEGER